MLCVLMAISTTSCVGTIEDTTEEKGDDGKLNIGKLEFSGITSAKAIAHNKVELTFPPAGNATGNITYLIKYDGLATPITAIEKSLFRNFNGEYTYTVTNLEPYTTYNFNVTAIDEVSGAEGNNVVTIQATTFLHPTADFGGIGLVSNVQGLAGLNSLKVEWVKAALYTDFTTPEDRDVVNYEVKILDGDLTPNMMNSPGLSNLQRKTILVDKTQREVTIGGLKQGHKYYVQVRAINYGYVRYSTEDPSFRHEENTKYIAASTLSPGAEDLSFDEDSFFVKSINSEGGLSSLSTSWIGAAGAFDHYRLIYTKSTNNADTEEAYPLEAQLYQQNGHIGGDDCLSNVTASSGFDSRCACENKDTHDNASATPGTDGEADLFCLYIEYDVENKIVADLEAYREYEMILQVCADVNCIEYSRSKVNRGTKTNPGIATYTFESSMRGPGSTNHLDKIYIDFEDQPDFTSGVIDGFQIKVTNSAGEEIILGNPDFPVNESITSQPPIRMLPYDPRTDQYITLSGYDIYDAQAYTFEISPYKNTGDAIEVDSAVKKIYTDIVFEALPPGNYTDDDKFQGPTSCSDIGSNTGNYRITWNPVAEGIGVFSHYQIWIEEKADPTDLSISGSAFTFPTIPLVDKSVTEYTVEGLDPTKDYVATVRTYFSLGGNQVILSPESDADVIGCN